MKKPVSSTTKRPSISENLEALEYLKMNVPTNRPNILAIIRRNNRGDFEQIMGPVEFHEQPMLTIIPEKEGVYVVLGLLRDEEKPGLNQLLAEIGAKVSTSSYAGAGFI